MAERQPIRDVCELQVCHQPGSPPFPTPRQCSLQQEDCLWKMVSFPSKWIFFSNIKSVLSKDIQEQNVLEFPFIGYNIRKQLGEEKVSFSL